MSFFRSSSVYANLGRCVTNGAENSRVVPMMFIGIKPCFGLGGLGA